MKDLFENKATSNISGGNAANNVAAAIAMALMPNSGMAAVAMALCLCNADFHDYESEVITMKSIGCTDWNSKSVKLLHSAYRR